MNLQGLHLQQSLISVLHYICIRVCRFTFFLQIQRFMAEVKHLPFSEVKPSHLHSHVLRQVIILKVVALKHLTGNINSGF